MAQQQQQCDTSAFWRMQDQLGAVGRCPCGGQPAPPPPPNYNYTGCSIMANGEFLCNDQGYKLMNQIEQAGRCPLPPTRNCTPTDFSSCTSLASGAFVCGSGSQPMLGLQYVDQCSTPIRR